IVTSADVTMEKEDELMIVENADEDSVQPWKKPHNPVQDKLIHPGHGAADEVIVKEGATCLTRADFWTLGLRREMESDVSSNICMEVFFDAPKTLGPLSMRKNAGLIYGHMLLHKLCNRTPRGSLLICIFYPNLRSIGHRLDRGQWTEVTGLDIGVLPQQINSNDCGVFMLMVRKCHSIQLLSGELLCVFLLRRLL
uniref:Si:dkey-13e3.1 n=1 Tax=Sinocyclocheilus rhinocerous TaxID=307959 RepID=A0A673FUF9_9TELE